MARTKNNTAYKPLVITGYLLFSLLVVATLFSVTVPWVQILLSSSSKMLPINVAVFTIALTVGSFLPVLLGYIIGGHSVKSNEKQRRRFNGMLFGLLAFWIMTICAVQLAIRIDGLDRNERVILVNLLPSAIAVVIGSVVGVAHTRSRQSKGDILEYKPFSVLLMTAILGLPALSLLHDIINKSIDMYSFTPLILIIIPGTISYFTLRKLRMSTSSMLAWVAVSVSVFFVVSATATMLTSVAITYAPQPFDWEVYETIRWTSYGLAFIGWLVYWVSQAKVLKQR